ncbi:hypothetical protein VTN31DRAFT_6492 [Thermomyces dupontii]|uniref:uncharacterized protein n=1 Tax=Talaromyces thermophilus TaxID=28565 RepID=UPI00374319E9
MTSADFDALSTAAFPSASPVDAQLNASTTARNASSLAFAIELLKLPFRATHEGDSTVLRQLINRTGLDLFLGRAAGGGDGEIVTGAAAAAAVTNQGARGAAGVVGRDGNWNLSDVLNTFRGFTSFFGYLTSRWSLACVAVALILNRVTIYASTRRHLRFSWRQRLLLRIIPIILLASHALRLLRAMRCQTSPDYGLIRYGRPEKRLLIDHSGSGGSLYSFSSTLLSWESDLESCSALGMNRLPGSSELPYGSFSLLWPVFLVLCLSYFIETLSCALQGRPIVTEAGMTIFEHSLAFAEAETAIGHVVGLGLFGLTKNASTKEDLPLANEMSESSMHLLTRSQILQRMNVTPELLLIVLISCCNVLAAHVLDVFGKQSRYRLVNTTFWGLCFMGAIAWGIFQGPTISSETGFLKFPTVCIVGFVPHLLILVGIAACACIYGLAVLITAFALPPGVPQPSSFRERLSLAYNNMQSSSQLQHLRLNMHEDFYTTLLKVGYSTLTAASDAVFLNEGRGVVARRRTWLEEDRLTEIEATRRARAGRTDVQLETGEILDFDVGPKEDWQSGYGREKKLGKVSRVNRFGHSASPAGGVGAYQGATRASQACAFLRGISLLVFKWVAVAIGGLLGKMGITFRPQWLSKLMDSNRNRHKGPTRDQPASLDFLILRDNGEFEIPDNNEFDVEKEMRKREASNRDNWQEADEARLDTKLYNWWKIGGSWGEQDESADYVPTDTDEDTTSIVSSQVTDSEWEDSNDDDDGRRTPTQEDPFPARSPRETLLDTASLARLLDPRDQESKEEARILAAHLAAENENRIMTRSQYRRRRELERARVLLPVRPQNVPPSSSSLSASDNRRPPTAEEEAEMLEALILARRREAQAKAHDHDSHPYRQHPNQTASNSQQDDSWPIGVGPDGPQCVVCQTNPRSIITWPCRCLCVCEECRVSLAMNNFATCVTCRQEVLGFVRLWVP